MSGESPEKDTPTISYPAIFQAMDSSSRWAQRTYLRNIRLELVILVLVAVIALVTLPIPSGLDAAGLAGAALFAGALVLQQNTARQRPEHRWYEARAATESVKTLAWRYAVCGDPFHRRLPVAEADGLFVRRLLEVMEQLDDVVVAGDATATGLQITPEMRALRAANLGVRRRAYAVGRIEDQYQWYASRAAHNLRRMRFWMNATLVLEAVGILSGIAKAAGLFGFSGDALGVGATLAAAVTAWTQTKQHSTLASAYAVTSQELAAINALTDHQRSELDWARFVDSSEAAMSREHTLWRASRTT